MNSRPVPTADAQSSNLGSPLIAFTSENESAETAQADTGSPLGTATTITLEQHGKNDTEEKLDTWEMKENVPRILSSGSGVVHQAQAAINGDDSPWARSSACRKSQRVKTLYTSQAPIEIISFFYRLGREAIERGSSSSFSWLPEDTPLPEPLQYERSLMLAFSDSVSYDMELKTPSHSLSDLSNRIKSVSHMQILQRSLSFLGQSMSQLSSETSVLFKATGKRSRNPSSITLDEDDIKILADESAEMNLKLTPKMRISHSARALDSVVEDQSTDTFSNLSLLGLGRAHRSFLSKRQKKYTLYTSVKRNRRCNSSDFAFSEANEISQVNVSTISSPNEAKKFLTHGEKEVRDPFMNMLKTHLNNGNDKKLVSKSMRRSRLWRDAVRREKLSDVSERGSESQMVGALLRAATENYENISNAQTPVSGGKKKYAINENVPLRFSNVYEEKGPPQ